MSISKTLPAPEVISFIRQKDYRMIKELGEGACGKTLLLHDDMIDESVVCKKYSPYSAEAKEALFAKFVGEVKLLLRLHHRNVVRIFNYFLYPKQHAGYILMEHIDGTDIASCISDQPELITDLFQQAIEGFAHLERSEILHRDIRPANLMVTNAGVLKIIDLGFGKQVGSDDDFEKSITLNWWCETPAEFSSSSYNFATEVYFVGKLFEQLISNNSIGNFRYRDVLRRMCLHSPEDRYQRFTEIELLIDKTRLENVDFSQHERSAYRAFSEALGRQLVHLRGSPKFQTDMSRIEADLNDALRKCTLEEVVPDAKLVISCFVNCTYRYKKHGFSVDVLRSFVQLFRGASPERRRLLLSNLHTRIDAIDHFAEEDDNDDVPF